MPSRCPSHCFGKRWFLPWITEVSGFCVRRASPMFEEHRELMAIVRQVCLGHERKSHTRGDGGSRMRESRHFGQCVHARQLEGKNCEATLSKMRCEPRKMAR